MVGLISVQSGLFQDTYIDSLDGFTFRNQLMSIMLVVATGQHLHTKVLGIHRYPV